eukprot:TRINITY_DN93_c0_g1_i3.p2 TRINITY_DN93_c0_g1~~TRINITY_DN93_c0_g1_i3.p2  ORF type:complete len:285 (+),score=76.34 TRINITY_DN93_c0_g1_i3:58-912(+)
MDVEDDGLYCREDILEIPVIVGEEDDPCACRDYVVEEPHSLSHSCCCPSSSSSSSSSVRDPSYPPHLHVDASSSSSLARDNVGKELVLYNGGFERLRSELDLWPRLMRSSVGTFPTTCGILSVLKDKLPMLHCDHATPVQGTHNISMDEPEIPNIGVKRMHSITVENTNTETETETEIEGIHPPKARRVSMDRFPMEWRGRGLPFQSQTSHSHPLHAHGLVPRDSDPCGLVGKRERCCHGFWESGTRVEEDVRSGFGLDTDDDVLMEAALECGRSPKRRKNAYI